MCRGIIVNKKRKPELDDVVYIVGTHSLQQDTTLIPHGISNEKGNCLLAMKDLKKLLMATSAAIQIKSAMMKSPIASFLDPTPPK